LLLFFKKEVLFFFEKNNQKTFIQSRWRCRAGDRHAGAALMAQKRI